VASYHSLVTYLHFITVLPLVISCTTVCYKCFK